MAKILSSALYDALRAAGIADANTQRVVIDIEVGSYPKVYVQRVGDGSLVDVIPVLVETRFDLVTAEVAEATFAPLPPADDEEKVGEPLLSADQGGQ
jgi:hypothetical protein